jgi:3D (Asp-Asp-Asp) domain-containing protein/peptidoglycan hydrolase CwlO-like protein
VLGCRPVRPASRTRARTSLLSLVAAGAASALLLGAAGARASDPETQRLQDAGEALAAESQSVVLELYALESRLARVQARLARLRTAAGVLEREQVAARRHLARVRADLAEANTRLAERLRQLYTESDPDPLAVLLGAESLDEAVATLDNLGRFAGQDRRVVAHVKRARGEVARTLRRLEKRKAELEALAREAAASQAELAAARGERQAYLARLREERRLNAVQLARAEAAAQAAKEKSAEFASEAPASEPAGGASGGSAGSGGASGGTSNPPAPPPASAPYAPAEAGTKLTVVATGYSLPGTTATGIRVGWGVVAVDPSVIPLGTRMTIPGYGQGVAADTGSAVRGAVIDLWFPTRAQALAWGRRTVTITLH